MDASIDPLQEAYDDYNAQLQLPLKEQRSIRQIAEDKDVWPSSLSLRIRNGCTTHKTGSQHLQALSPGEEASLYEYILRMGAIHHSPPPGTVFELAEELRRKRLIREGYDAHSIHGLGKNWLGKFKKRHPDISTVLSRSVDRSRFDGTTPERLIPWFRELELMMDRHHYSPNNIYNMDESGYAIGTSGSHPVMVSRKYPEKGKSSRRKEEKAQPGRQEWVTTVECISAAGRLLPPLVIFKSKAQFNTRWLPDHAGNLFQGWYWSTSAKGWTNNTLGLDWLLHHFIPHTKPQNPQDRRLLILDGHGSHCRADFIASCIDNNIDLMLLPAHSSHKTQPLDVGVFATLKAEMTKEINRTAPYTRGRIPRDQWANTLRDARLNGITKHNILTGFQKSGIFPFNPGMLVNNYQTPPSTPPPDPTRLSRTPLSTIASENRQFINNYNGSAETPLKKRFYDLVNHAERSEKIYADFEIARDEVEKLRDAQKAAKRKRKGITVENTGTHILSSQEVLAMSREGEAETEANRQRYEARKARVDRLEPVDYEDMSSD